jgi:acyl-CoA synthetase (NDP forming)
VLGVPCYKSVEDIPQRLDLAVITTKADRVPAIVDACGRAGTKAVVIMPSGFSDAGPRGRMLEKNTSKTPAATASACSAPTAWACCAPSSASTPASPTAARSRAPSA